jgi:hypothetical protein
MTEPGSRMNEDRPVICRIEHNRQCIQGICPSIQTEMLRDATR